MGDVVSKVGGLIALGVILFWVWKDGDGTVRILEALGAGNDRLVSSLEGRA
jgi:hypothetical protein